MNALQSCRGCRRLTRHLDKMRAAHPDWHNAPVPPIGPIDANLLILGLAPGRLGANRTGKPFVGDKSAKWLMTRLKEAGCLDANGSLVNTQISNAVKCLPPQNRPKTDEIKRCVERWLIKELHGPSVILALGRVAHESVLRAFKRPFSQHPFSHGATHDIEPVTLIDSFHPSPLNTQTGRLSAAQFRSVLDHAKKMAQFTY